MKRSILILSVIICQLSSTHVKAQGFDNLPDPIEDVNKVVDNTPDSIAKALMSRPAPGSTRQGNSPVLFLIGNSTMRNGTLGRQQRPVGLGLLLPQVLQCTEDCCRESGLGWHVYAYLLY